MHACAPILDTSLMYWGKHDCDGMNGGLFGGQMTIDSHLEVYLAQIECTDEGDQLFIKQVVYGCIRFKKLNKINLTALYFKHGTEVSREDYHLYMVLSYLTIMRLEDMGIPVFRKFIFSQDYQKMFVWLSFIFNTQVLALLLHWLLHT